MSIYAQALKRYLEDSDAKQRELGEAIGKTQVSVHRYALGLRTPDRETADRIDKATGGVVSMAIWQRLQMDRLGIAPTPTEQEAA